MFRSLFAAAALALLASGTMAGPIRIATEGAYPPFNFVDDSGAIGGFDVEVGNEMCKRAGLECTWTTNEWDTLIANLQAGNYDAIMADMTITDERKKTIDFSTPYFPPDPSTYISRAATTYDYTALSGLKIGAQGNTIQAKYLSDTYKDTNTVVTFATVDQAVADLQAGNIDLVLAEGSYVGEQVDASNGALKADGPDVPIGDGAGVGLRKDSADLKAKLDAALTAMKADGWLDALITKTFPDMAPGPYFAP